MNKKFLLFLLVSTLSTGLSAQKWEKKANQFPGDSRESGITFVIGNAGYAGLGQYSEWGTSKDSTYNDLWKYDPAKDSWTKMADFPGTARFSSVAFVIKGKAYVGLGYGSYSRYKDFYEYDPAANKWTKIADFPGSARSGAVAFVIGDAGYVGTGNDGEEKGDFYKYENSVWSAIASLPKDEERADATAFSINNFGYVAGGGYVGVLGSPANMYQYDPAANQWVSEVSYSSTLASNVISSYVSDNTPYFSTFDELSRYDLEEGVFENLGDVFKLGQFFSRESFFVINNVPYMVWGTGDSQNQDVWYDADAVPTGIASLSSNVISLNISLMNGLLFINSPEVNGTSSIFSSTGSLLMSQEVNGTQSSINVATLPPGVYVVFVQSGGKRYSAKFVK